MNQTKGFVTKKIKSCFLNLKMYSTVLSKMSWSLYFNVFFNTGQQTTLDGKMENIIGIIDGMKSSLLSLESTQSENQNTTEHS